MVLVVRNGISPARTSMPSLIVIVCGAPPASFTNLTMPRALPPGCNGTPSSERNFRRFRSGIRFAR